MTCIERHINLRGNYPQHWCDKRKKEIGYHRWLWEQHNGTIPPGQVVRHKCDNPKCINIDHLEIGTHQDNVNDKMQRDRHYAVKGIEHGQHKLTDAQVLGIRAKHNIVKKRILAEQYGVTVRTIQDIQYRKSWKHI